MRPSLHPHLPRMREAAAQEPIGLYLHIPFCRDRCAYCSFVSTTEHDLMERVLAKLREDILGWGRVLGTPRVDTLYLGGGTPSLLSLESLTGLASVVHEAFALSSLQEATLEANPDTLGLPWLKGARKLGFDRLSLGIQTLDDALLKRLGRTHDAAEGVNALLLAQEAGFSRISADLMLGIPGQDLERILSDARILVSAGATHLSIYMLDLDKASPLRASVERGECQLPSEDEVATAFEALQEALPDLGLEPYEISNYAVPGESSIHNTRYWERRPYLGLGPSAASHLDRWRWTEHHDLRAWMQGGAKADIQELDAVAELAEIPLLGLRMHRGVDWEYLQHQAALLDLSDIVDAWERSLRPLFQHDLLVREGPILRLTSKGMLLSNAVLQVFV